MAKQVGKTAVQRPVIWWTLKQMGDVNENHAGGDAGKVLREAAVANGLILERSADFGNVMESMRRMGAIEIIKDPKSNKYKIIRLLQDPTMPCPFKQAPAQQELGIGASLAKPSQPIAVSIPVAAESSLLNGHRNWSIDDRLKLIAELSQSVAEDLAHVGKIFASQ